MVSLGANNLYKHSVKQLLSIQILCWVNPKKLNRDIYPDDGAIDCLLEVDLDLPDKLHEKVAKEMLAEYQLEIKEENKCYLGKVKNLNLNLDDRKIQTPI